MSDKNSKAKKLGVIIPVIIAVIVVCAFAVSGHITRNLDGESPTAQTSEASTTQQTTNAVSKVSFWVSAFMGSGVRNTVSAKSSCRSPVFLV